MTLGGAVNRKNCALFEITFDNISISLQLHFSPLKLSLSLAFANSSLSLANISVGEIYTYNAGFNNPPLRIHHEAEKY
jgi:hypothetical protein